jgi:hypothetical protein
MFNPALGIAFSASGGSSFKGMFSALLMLASAIAIIDSPQRWQTFKRVGIAFVATLIVGLLIGVVIATHVHSSTLSQTLGEYSAYLAMASASLFGWYHVRTLRRQPK